MIAIMNEMPGNVLGISAQGIITGRDYKNVMIPAIADRLESDKMIRVLYYLGDKFERFDLTEGEHSRYMESIDLIAVEKIAFVSNHQVVQTIRFLSHLLPFEFRIFSNNELDAAKLWLSNDDNNDTDESSWLQDALDKIDTSFPLSGGETVEDMEHVMA